MTENCTGFATIDPDKLMELRLKMLEAEQEARIAQHKARLTEIEFGQYARFGESGLFASGQNAANVESACIGFPLAAE